MTQYGVLEDLLKDLADAAGDEDGQVQILKLVHKLVSNALLDDDKFRVLRKSNPILDSKLFRYKPQCTKLLHYLGFRETDDTFVLKPEEFNEKLLKETRELLWKRIEALASQDFQPAGKKRKGCHSSSSSSSILIRASSSSSSSSNLKQQSEVNGKVGLLSEVLSAPSNQVSLSDVTVFCDVCGKARILSVDERNLVFKNEDMANVDFSCIMLPRLRDSQQCKVPDDELAVITGLGFAQVLDKLGINTRAKLAASSSDDFDAGDWASYLQKWIERAQLLELDDIMGEILVDTPNDILAKLRELGIAAPLDLIDHQPHAIVELWVARLAQVEEFTPTIEVVEKWHKNAKEKLEEIPWLKNWSAIHSMQYAAEEDAVSSLGPQINGA